MRSVMRSDIPNKRPRTETNLRPDRRKDPFQELDFLRNELGSRDRLIRELQTKLEASHRKKQHVQRAYYTMIRDTRAEATKMRLFIEQVEKDDDETFHEDVVQTITTMSSNLINLGHCPLSMEPLGENTFVNICGHIFDKRALCKDKPRLCPKCSHKMIAI